MTSVDPMTSLDPMTSGRPGEMHRFSFNEGTIR